MTGKHVWAILGALALSAGGASAQLGTTITILDVGTPSGLAAAAAGAVGVPSPDTGILGIETTGVDMAGNRVYWITTRGDTTNPAGVNNGTHYIFEVDELGAVGSFVMQAIPTLGACDWGMRDLAFDGQFLYGGCGAALAVPTVLEFDPVTATFTGVELDFSPCIGLGTTPRALAYRPSDGHFIVANFGSGIFDYDPAGPTCFGPVMSANPYYGFAITTNQDPPTGVAGGGTFSGMEVGERLWGFHQGGSQTTVPPTAPYDLGFVEIFLTNPFNVMHLTLTGTNFIGNSPLNAANPGIVGGVAGGLCAYADQTTGLWELAAIHQATPDHIVRYEHSPHMKALASVTNLGGGCPGTAGLPALSSTTPAEGWMLSVDLVSSSPAPSTGILVISTAGAGLPLPIFPGPCTLIPSLAGAVLVAGIPLAANPASTNLLSLVMPIDPAISNASVAIQVFQVDLTSPNALGGLLPVAMSDALGLTIGVHPF